MPNPAVTTGDVYRERSIIILVGDVDPDDGRWAMIHCTVIREDWRHEWWLQEWDKQQSIPAGCFPDGWELIGHKNPAEPERVVSDV
jgi:hypothetical protein